MAYSPNFNAAIEVVKKSEGGYVNHPADSGGATNWGIAYNYNKSALAKIGVTSPEQMRALTWEQAKSIYHANYWKPLWDDIPVEWAKIIFDFFVNASANAIRALQLALVAAGRDIEADGAYGAKTQQALLQTDGNKGRGYFRYFMLVYYNTIVKRNPSQSVFLKGWENRVKNTGQVIEPSKLELQRADNAIKKKNIANLFALSDGTVNYGGAQAEYEHGKASYGSVSQAEAMRLRSKAAKYGMWGAMGILYIAIVIRTARG